MFSMPFFDGVKYKSEICLNIHESCKLTSIYNVIRAFSYKISWSTGNNNYTGEKIIKAIIIFGLTWK